MYEQQDASEAPFAGLSRPQMPSSLFRKGVFSMPHTPHPLSPRLSSQPQKLPFLLPAGILLCGVLLCVFPAQCAQGALKGVNCCLQVLIPSLFPFMVLSVFAVRTGAADALGKKLEKPFRFLFHLPGSAAAVLLMSLTGGYPVGARSTAALLESGALDRQEAERMLCFCVNAGPAFILSVVGAGYLQNPQAGVLLLAGQVSACLILGILCRGKESPHGSFRQEPRFQPAGTSLILSVSDAVRSILSACAFVVLFGTVSELLNTFLPEGNLSACLTAFLEVTQGCGKLAQNGFPLWVLALTIGWGGLSVHFQIFSLLKPSPISAGKFRFFRLLHGGLAAGITFLLEQCFPLSEPAAASFSNFSGALHPVQMGTPAASAALLLLSFLFLSSLPSHSRKTPPI